MPDEQKDPRGGSAGPAQLYRFRVRTSDGRELVSAVAVVDPNASDQNQHDPADSMEELEQKHQTESREHDGDLGRSHQEESQRHADDLAAHHEDISGKHIEAVDAKHEAETTKAETDLKAGHADELEAIPRSVRHVLYSP